MLERDSLPNKPLRFVHDIFTEFRPAGEYQGWMMFGGGVWILSGLLIGFGALGVTGHVSDPSHIAQGLLDTGLTILGGKMGYRALDATVNAARVFSRRERGEYIHSARKERNDWWYYRGF